MANEAPVAEKNPFEGVGYGTAVRMLLAQPDLAPKFDKVFKDEAEFDTLERARLHSVNSFYRNTLAGSMALKALSILATEPPKEEASAAPDPAEEARNAWAQRLRKGVTKEEDFVPLTRQRLYEEHRAKYESVLDDLANYERMRSVGSTLEVLAVLGGALAGGIATPENLFAWPIRGATAIGRMVWGGLQTGTISTLTDPLVQGLNISAGALRERDWHQTILAFPIGAVIGGGLVGMGEVVSKTLLRKEIKSLATEDPAFRTSSMDLPEAKPKEEFIPGSKVEKPDLPKADEAPSSSYLKDTAEGKNPIPSIEELDDLIKKAATIENDGLTPEQVTTLKRLNRQIDRGGTSADEASIAKDKLLDSLPPQKENLDVMDSETLTQLKNEFEVLERSPFESVEEFEDGIARVLKRYFGRFLDGDDFSKLVFQKAFQELENNGLNSKDVGKSVINRFMEGLSESDQKFMAQEIKSFQAPKVDAPKESRGALRAEQDIETAAKLSDRGGFVAGAKTTDVMEVRGALPKADEAPKVDAPDVMEARGALRAEPKKQTNYIRPPAIVKSLQKMVAELEKALGIPIRQGKEPDSAKNVVATFNWKTGVIRIKEYPDFSVATHEIAHGLEARIGKDLTQLTDNFAHELGPLDYDLSQKRTFEGFAEFVRLWITNPAYAQLHAPGFTSSFQNFMEVKQPEVFEKLVGFQQAYKNYLAATPEQAVAAMIVTPRETWGDKIVKRLTDAKVAPTVRNVMSLVYDALFNQNEDMNRATRALAAAIKEKQNGKLVDILPSEDPRVLFALLNRSSQVALVNLLQGVVPKNGTHSEGPAFAQALTTALGKSSLTGKWNSEMLDKFASYLVSRRGIYKWDQFYKGELPNPPFAESQDYLIQVLKKLDTEFPQFKLASDMVHEFNRNYLRRGYEAGLFGLTTENYNKIIQEPFYVPLNRDVSDLKTGSGSKTAPNAAVKGFEGSLRDIINPITQIINHALATERAIAHGDTVKALVKLSARLPGGAESGKFVEPLPAHEVRAIEIDLMQAMKSAFMEEGHGGNDAASMAHSILMTHFGDDHINGTMFKTVIRDGRKEPIVFYAERGELKAARMITKEEGYRGGHRFGLYELLTTMPKPAADLGVQLMSAVSQTLTMGIVTHPAYALRNFFRDQFSAAILVPGYIPFYHGVKGLAREIGQGQVAQGYAQAGGVSPGVQIAPMSELIKLDIDVLAKKGYGIHKITTLGGLAHALSFMESGTRLGVYEVVYNQKIKMGLSQYDAQLAAAYEATDLLNFGRWGSHTEVIRKFTPFLGPWIQGLDKTYRTMVEPLRFFLGSEKVLASDSADLQKAGSAFIKAGVVGFGWGAMWAALNYDQFGYFSAGPSVRAANIIIPIGDDKVFLLPKNWELSMGFTAGEYAFMGVMKDDPRAGWDFMKAAIESLAPPIPFWSNPAIKTSAELYFNKNTFTGRSIVPQKLQEMENEFQVNSQTSAIAKRIGNMTGWSPIKVDFALGGFGGYWGRDVSMMSQGDEETDVTSNLMDWALLRSGIKDPAQISNARELFWKHMGRTTGDYPKALNTYNGLMATPRTEEQAKAYFNTLSSNRKAWIVLNTAGNDEGKKVFTADDLRSHPLHRSVEAVSVLSAMRTQLLGNNLVDSETKKPLLITPDQQKRLGFVFGQMTLAEMANGLIITHEPGYDKRPLFDMSVFLKRIEGVSPAIAEEVKARYATRKIYKTDEIARVYDQVQKELIQFGSEADLSLTTTAVTSAGFEFDILGLGERRKRPLILRGTIPGGKL